MNKKVLFLLFLFVPGFALAMEDKPLHELSAREKKLKIKADKKARRKTLVASRLAEADLELLKEEGRQRGEEKKAARVMSTPASLKNCSTCVKEAGKRVCRKFGADPLVIHALENDTPLRVINALAGGKRDRDDLTCIEDEPISKKRASMDTRINFSKALFEHMMSMRDVSCGAADDAVLALYQLIQLTLDSERDVTMHEVGCGAADDAVLVHDQPIRPSRLVARRLFYTEEELGEAACHIRSMLSVNAGHESLDPSRSFEFQLEFSKLDKAVRREFLYWESLIRDFKPTCMNKNLSRLVLMDHIINGASEGGGHVFPEKKLQADNLILHSAVHGGFEPLKNCQNKVTVLRRIFAEKEKGREAVSANEPKTHFPREIAHEEVFKIAHEIGASSTPYAEDRSYLERDNCRCVLQEAQPGLFVEIVDEALDSTGFGTIRSCYPIFSFTQWQADQPEICLAEVEPCKSHRQYRLCLSSVEIIRIVKDARAEYEAKKDLSIKNPVRYERDETYIVDIAPILLRLHEREETPFWSELPQSVVPKGIYVEIPKTELDRI